MEPVISSRRLAREWALKILYQMDVGRVSRDEAMEAALERLRSEFVQRGSRTASGSPMEQACLNAVTRRLGIVLPGLRAPFERVLTGVAARLFDEVPYWYEVRWERSFRNQMPGVSLVPGRLLTPLPDAHFIPALDSGDPLTGDLAQLNADERRTLELFVIGMREMLPPLIESDAKKLGLALARDMAANRPVGASGEALQAYLRPLREQFNQEQQERWKHVGTIVRKQTGDWLRTAAFVVKLVDGTGERQKEVDTAIEALSSGWRLERQVAVDRNIMRLAGFELLFLPGVPAGASINEAVELAKKFSTAESGKFVNGVLGTLAHQVGDKLNAHDVDAIEAGDDNDALDLPDLSDIEDRDDQDDAPDVTTQTEESDTE